MSKYVKKPVVIDAIQYTGDNMKDIACFMGVTGLAFRGKKIFVPTLEGEALCSPGAYIIKGISGEFYPCDEEIFYKTYEPVPELEETICEECTNCVHFWDDILSKTESCSGKESACDKYVEVADYDKL